MLDQVGLPALVNTLLASDLPVAIPSRMQGDLGISNVMTEPACLGNHQSHVSCLERLDQPSVPLGDDPGELPSLFEGEGAHLRPCSGFLEGDIRWAAKGLTGDAVAPDFSGIIGFPEIRLQGGPDEGGLLSREPGLQFRW